MDILLLHGALGDAKTLDGIAGILETDYRVHRFDFSGHGCNELEQNISIEQFATEVRDYITKHQLVSPLIFGYSMGGYAALKMAAKNPGLAGGIFTLATKFDWNPLQAKREAQMLDPIVIVQKAPAFADALKLRHGDKWDSLCQATARMMLALGEAPSLNFSVINCPVLISVGALDKMVTVEESMAAARAIPGAGFHLFDNMQHPIEKADVVAVARCMRSFFGIGKVQK